MANKNDRYKECIYVNHLNQAGSIYTVVEVDKQKGIRVSVVDSEKSKILRNVRLNNLLKLEHLEALS